MICKYLSFSLDSEFLFFLIKKALKRIKNQKNQEYTKIHRIIFIIPIDVLNCLWSLRSISINDLHTDDYHGGFDCSNKLVYSLLPVF